MNRTSATHLDDRALLHFADSELPHEAMETARRHLDGCRVCRSRADELNLMLRQISLQDRQFEEALTPFVPGQWDSLDEMLTAAQTKRTVHIGPSSRNLSRFAVIPRLARVALAASAVACLALAILYTDRWLRTGAKERTPAQALTPRPARPAPAPATTHATNFSPSRITPPVIREENTARAEVAATAALHRVQADLGEPLTMSVDERGYVVVAFNGLPADREAEIRAALSSLSGVIVRPSSTEATPVNPSAAPGGLAIHSGQRPFRKLLEDAAGGSAKLDQLANAAQDEADLLVGRAYAIRRLDEQFPSAKLAALPADSRNTIESIRADHRDAWRVHAQRILSLLAPVRKALGAVPGQSPAAADLLAMSQRMDAMVGILFGGAPSGLTPEELSVAVEAAAAQLERAIGEAQ